MLTSSRLPIGVPTMYRPGFIFLLFTLFIFLISCSPAFYSSSNKIEETNDKVKINSTISKNQSPKIITDTNDAESTTLYKLDSDSSLKKEIVVILPLKTKSEITKQLINIIELSVYNKKIKNINFDINLYKDSEELIKIIENKKQPGKIFIGPIDSYDTQLLHNFCKDGLIFFSFSSKKSLGNNCVFLVNFFPQNELKVLFDNFKTNSKIALLYPENSYGYRVNSLIDDIAQKSNSVIINRASYSEDLTNVREAIKELGKYELRKYELNRQKKILESKQDESSKKRLKKLEKFNTTTDLEFTHIIIPDYGIRLLQVAPLLPYYDIDPNLVQFVGTGVWDDPAFFTEPSLQGAIFPGIEASKRSTLLEEYNSVYSKKLMRISTLPYDLIGLLNYMFEKEFSIINAYDLLNSQKIKFDGIDGKFYFANNIIERELHILKIENGNAKKIN